MPEETLVIELTRSEAIACSEALACSGDDVAETCGIAIRNAIGDAQPAEVYYWTNDNEEEHRLYRAGFAAPRVQARNDNGEWEDLIDLAEADYRQAEVVILEQLVTILLGGEDDDDQ